MTNADSHLRNTKRRSLDVTTKPTRWWASPPSATQSLATSLTKTWSCFLWQLTQLDVLDPSSNTSSLPSNPQAHSHLRLPNITPPRCTPNLCASQAQKESSTWPTTIGKLPNHTSFAVTHIPPNPHYPHTQTTRTYSHKSISVMWCADFTTTLFPLHPWAIRSSLFWSKRENSKTKYNVSGLTIDQGLRTIRI